MLSCSIFFRSSLILLGAGRVIAHNVSRTNIVAKPRFFTISKYVHVQQLDPRKVCLNKQERRMSSIPEGDNKEYEGSLSFTRTSLYRLALPLKHQSSGIRMAEKLNLTNNGRDRREKNEISQEMGAAGAFSDKKISTDDTLDKPCSRTHYTYAGQNGHQVDNVQNVNFLLHSEQPLSYIANLIRSEGVHIESSKQPKSENSIADPTGQPPITFYTTQKAGQRWSPAIGIGDFLREAARGGNFLIYVGNQRIRVNVPSFEERTRFLRSSLHAKTAQIERLAILKGECDRVAHKAAQRMAFAGAGVLCAWWVTVGVLTFNTPLGWDIMEPITYLTGLGMVIWGYLWFLWHNREVSYRTVLTETTSRRQRKLYDERGFDIHAYHELITEAKDLRRAIKRVAWDYGIDWDQGKTSDGKNNPLAIDVVRKEEAKDRMVRKDIDDSEEDEAFQQSGEKPDSGPRR